MSCLCWSPLHPSGAIPHIREPQLCILQNWQDREVSNAIINDKWLGAHHAQMNRPGRGGSPVTPWAAVKRPHPVPSVATGYMGTVISSRLLQVRDSSSTEPPIFSRDFSDEVILGKANRRLRRLSWKCKCMSSESQATGEVQWNK